MTDNVRFGVKDKIFIAIVFLGLSLSFCFKVFDFFNKNEWLSFGRLEKKEKISDSTWLNLKIKETVIEAEVVLSDEKKIAGLSQRAFLNKNQGMIFIFSESGQYDFTMKEMNFPLDFIFIKNNIIVDIIKNTPHDFEGNINGKTSYDKVLEVEAGWSDENKVSIGDEIRWKIK